MRFAATDPGRYQILFQRSPVNLSQEPQLHATGIRAFGLLSSAIRQAITEGTSTSTDPTRDAQALWAALHGLTTIIPATPGFPWKRVDDLVGRLIDTVAELRQAGRDLSLDVVPPSR